MNYKFQIIYYHGRIPRPYELDPQLFSKWKPFNKLISGWLRLFWYQSGKQFHLISIHNVIPLIKAHDTIIIT